MNGYPIDENSGCPVTVSPLFNKRITGHVPPDPALLPRDVKPDRGTFADRQMPNLLKTATRVDLTETIGTVLEGIQLSQLDDAQKDELALLVSVRGVVFFREQDLNVEQQVALFKHYGDLDRHPAQPSEEYITILGATRDFRAEAAQTPWPQGDWHSDTSFEVNPPSYSMLRMEEHPPVGGDTAWCSMYGLYDSLSTPYKRLFESLHAVHTSRLMYETLLGALGALPRRAPIDSHHPAVRTHPVTNLKALNLNPGFVTGLAELTKMESDYLLEFVWRLLLSADDHAVRWKWAKGSVAMWDNRCTVHRAIPGTYTGVRKGTRTTVFGERPYYDPASEGQRERTERLTGESVFRNGFNGYGKGDAPTAS